MQGRNTVVKKSESPQYKVAGIERASKLERTLKDGVGRRGLRWRRRGLMALVALSALLFEPPRAPEGDFTNAAVAAGDAKSSGQKKETREVVTPNTPLSNDQLQVLKTLEKKRDELEKREEELKRREERLKVAEKSLEVKYGELKAVRDEITRLFEEEKKGRDDRLKMMVNTIFINMKPDQAALVLAKMDSATVLRMMPLVPEKQLSKVLEKMDKDRAAALTTDYMNQKMKLPKPPQGGGS